MKMNDPTARNPVRPLVAITPGSLPQRYFFLSTLVTVSPDCVNVT